MESLLSQSRAMCPFLQRTSPATLRSLSTATSPSPCRASTSASPGGGTMSNIQVIARRCPVMSKALAVQTARLAGPKRFASSSSSSGPPPSTVSGSRRVNGKVAQVQASKRGLHVSGGKEASADGPVNADRTRHGHEKQGRGMFPHLPYLYTLIK